LGSYKKGARNFQKSGHWGKKVGAGGREERWGVGLKHRGIVQRKEKQIFMKFLNESPGSSHGEQKNLPGGSFGKRDE